MEGSTNIGGGVKQLLVGSGGSTSTEFHRDEGWGYGYGAQSQPWGDYFWFLTKVSGDYQIFYSPAYSSYNFTAPHTGEMGWRIIRIRSGVTTVLQSYIFNFFTGVSYSSGSNINPINHTVTAVPNDTFRIQHRNQYAQILAGRDTTGTRNVTPTQRAWFNQNTIVTMYP